ncbi:MAG: class I SAM-dependent methyltransferase [Deltaproteobacteria bacterium]|nr:class I SAM-dependent methyltransferase [Deltaproteobacteria bacterium]
MMDEVKFKSTLNMYNKAASITQYSETARTGLSEFYINWLKERALSVKNIPVRFLDLGCADGFVGSILRNFSVEGEFTGIDFSENMLAQCTQNGFYYKLFQRDLNFGINLEENAGFDYICATGFMEYIENPVKLLNEIHTYLLPGGELWISFEKKNKVSIENITSKLTNEVIQSFLWTHNEVESFIQESGFILRSIVENTAYTLKSVNYNVPFFFVVATVPE